MAAQITKQFARSFSTTGLKKFTVALIGASGGVGQPLALLLKQDPKIKTLVIHDIKATVGTAEDLSHISTPTRVQVSEGPKELEDAIAKAHLIIVCGGIARKPGMTRDDLFEKNAKVVKDVAVAVVNANPCAFLHIITNPVNALVPLVCAVFETMKKGNCNHVFGITTLDLVRAATFLAELKEKDPSQVHVPVVGGHAGETIVPLFSKTQPEVKLCPFEMEELTKKVQDGGTIVVKAKAGQGSATLSTAFAAYRAASNFLKGLRCGATTETYYVKSKVTSSKFFSTPLVIGKHGVECNLGIPDDLSCFEKESIYKALKALEKSIEKGEEFGKKCD